MGAEAVRFARFRDSSFGKARNTRVRGHSRLRSPAVPPSLEVNVSQVSLSRTGRPSPTPFDHSQAPRVHTVLTPQACKPLSDLLTTLAVDAFVPVRHGLATIGERDPINGMLFASDGGSSSDPIRSPGARLGELAEPARRGRSGAALLFGRDRRRRNHEGSFCRSSWSSLGCRRSPSGTTPTTRRADLCGRKRDSVDMTGHARSRAEHGTTVETDMEGRARCTCIGGVWSFLLFARTGSFCDRT